MLDQITPVILTLNEAPNIVRILERLTWARDVVVVDSLSQDDTAELASRFPNTRVVPRKYDELAIQWNYGLHETDIRTEWILALDADYIATDELIEEIKNLTPTEGVGGYQASFIYCVWGKRLAGSLYPPVTVLFRKEGARYRQDGHAHRIVVPEGSAVVPLQAKMLHDDWKPLSTWLHSQHNYMLIEARMIHKTPWSKLRWSDRIRKLRVVAPFAVLFYALIYKGGLFQGRAGWFYAFQRSIAEMVLALHLFTEDLRPGSLER